jgi:hypothetical protein
MLPKIPTYTFINFQEIFPPILFLFSPIFLLVFEEISHLYFYSDSSSIRNSRREYMFITILDIFLHALLLRPTRLLKSDKVSHLHGY